MKLRELVRTALLAGMATLMMVANASATNIVFNTNAAETGFDGGGLSLNSLFGANATLEFVANGDTATGTPSNVNLGAFNLSCTTCSTRALGIGAYFGPFVFNLMVTDVTNNATGLFIGTSSGGTVYSNASPINVIWAPLQLGPGGTYALTGDFGDTFFSTTSFTGIVAPNSGAVPGRSTVQGYVQTIQTPPNLEGIPEPSTLGMVGSLLFGLALLRQRLSIRN